MRAKDDNRYHLLSMIVQSVLTISVPGCKNVTYEKHKTPDEDKERG